MKRLPFQVEAVASGSRARAARFRTLHNEVLTPVFMPVGTHATVRAQTRETLLESGSQVLLANTYHLLLRPGPEVFKRLGGIHGFAGWPKSVLTDSGGFQIFCMPNSRQMTEEGARFQSYVDGERILLTPERSIEVQRAIGSDIMMVLDQCVPSVVDHATAKAAMELTHRWAQRSLIARGDSPQSLFGIVQGACYQDLRKQSAETICSMDFEGFALGGLAVGETKAEREDTTEFAAQLLPADRPRYLMGVGTPIDLLEAVHRGVDMFDCILPTAMAQQGVAFTSRGKIQLRRSVYKFSDQPLDPACTCPTCKGHSRAYLHHLAKVKEQYGWQLIGQHNIYFYHQLMREMREAILKDTFSAYYKEARERIAAADEEFPPKPPSVNRKRPREKGDYEILVKDERARIRQKSSGEVMHSVIDPEVEANTLYVEQSGILEEAAKAPGQKLVVWDVGLGAAHNAMALIRAYEERAAAGIPMAEIEIHSFENDLDSLKLVLEHPALFPHVRHPAPHAMGGEGEWRSRKLPISWKLHTGDFRTTYRNAALPNAVFYDMFSRKTDARFWEVGFFRELREYLGEQAAEFFTYTNSTAVRAALLAAGFFVAHGRATGPKTETTIICTLPDKVLRPREFLGADWLKKWERSHMRLPLGADPAEEASWLARVRSHEQFRSLQ